MQHFGASVQGRIPFLRILIPFIAGILLQYYFQLSLLPVALAIATGVLLMLVSVFFSTSTLYRLRWLPGLGLFIAALALGAFIFYAKNIENDAQWVGKHYEEKQAILVTLQEPLVEKKKTYKAIATIDGLVKNDSIIPVKGKMLVYFRKESVMQGLGYGSQVVIQKPLQRITNSGNPGAFNYQQYSAFRDIYHQVFLKQGEFIVLAEKNTNWFQQLLIDTRLSILGILRNNIREKNELGVAEALLIGYREDLDKELLQSYSNTGVVHIIAISGLHLGMIYAALSWFFSLSRNSEWKRWVRPLVIFLVLWIFTFIAGGVPSIMRSAVMFSCIILGETLSRRTSIYNTLAVTAFILLLINPFYLWDVGFQLSVAAVLSIVAFSRPIFNWFYIKNKILKGLWKLSSVTLSAQLLTMPIILYHFHQFPNLFLLTNFIVVPLSGIILFAEIFLLALSFIPVLAKPFGALIEWMIEMMNLLIVRTDRLPFAVTDGIQVSILQTILLMVIIIYVANWLLNRKKSFLLYAVAAATVFTGLRSIDMVRVNQQQKLVVYNIPQYKAIDVVQGSRFQFIGDGKLLEDQYLENFHLRPSRIANRIHAGPLSFIAVDKNQVRSGDKNIVILDSSSVPLNNKYKIRADAIIITGNPRLYIRDIIKHYDCQLVVFDATNPYWKIELWKKDCDSLHLRHHSVPGKGAFIMDL